MSATMKAHIVEGAVSSAQRAVNVHVDNLPDGSLGDGSVGASKLADGAVTEAKLADGAVTSAKIAVGVIPGQYVLPPADTEALGGVKKVAHVADPVGETPTKAEFVSLRDALVASGLMAPS